MVTTTDIEKRSLETHVELCAERYKFLEEKIENMDEKIDGQGLVIREVHDMVQTMSEKRNDQLINWGVGIIVFLTGIVGWLLVNYVLVK